MSNIEYEEHADGYETLHAIVAGVIAIVSIMITTMHSHKVYQDLFTPERKSLEHRRIKNPIDRAYKKSTYLTLITVTLYTIFMLTTAIQFNFLRECNYFPRILGDLAFWGSKAGLYLIYILRLHQIYGESTYGYRKKTIICWAVTVVVCVGSLWLIAQIGSIMAPLFRDDTDNQFPFYCQIDIQESYVLFMVLGAGLMLFEVTACITSIIAFIVPLNKVKALMVNVDHDEETKKHFAKVVYAGQKYKVIVIAASLYTLLWLGLYMVNVVVVAAVLYQIDMVWNPVCLLLMTPYYPSNRYYEVLCCPCLRICDTKGVYKSSAAVQEEPLSRSGAGSSKRTVDTSQVVKGYADDVPPTQSRVDSVSIQTKELSTAEAAQSTTITTINT